MHGYAWAMHGELYTGQKNLLDLTSANCDITMTEVKKVQSDINDLKASLEHTGTVLEEKAANQRRKYKNYRSKLMS